MLQYVMGYTIDPGQQDQHVWDWARHIEPELQHQATKRSQHAEHANAYWDKQINEAIKPLIDLSDLEALLRS